MFFKILLLFTFSAVTVLSIEIVIKQRPLPDDRESRLIWYNSTTYADWSHKIDNYLEAYRSPRRTEGRVEKMVNCEKGKPPGIGKVCEINAESFNPCSSTNYFGYKRMQPCIFIELDMIPNWEPTYYKSTKELPSHMPNHLKNLIDIETADPMEWDKVWVSCEGETPADMEAIGPLKYYPTAGFQSYLLQNSNLTGYLNPLVAIQFERLLSGMVVNVECRIWAKGLQYDSKRNIGVTNFQFLLDF